MLRLSESSVIAHTKLVIDRNITMCMGDHRVMALVARVYRYRGIKIKFKAAPPNIIKGVPLWEFTKQQEK